MEAVRIRVSYENETLSLALFFATCGEPTAEYVASTELMGLPNVILNTNDYTDERLREVISTLLPGGLLVEFTANYLSVEHHYYDRVARMMIGTCNSKEVLSYIKHSLFFGNNPERKELALKRWSRLQDDV